VPTALRLHMVLDIQGRKGREEETKRTKNFTAESAGNAEERKEEEFLDWMNKMEEEWARSCRHGMSFCKKEKRGLKHSVAKRRARGQNESAPL
jgi:hypothetical protein